MEEREAQRIVDACYDDVLAYCRRHAPRGCDAQDLVQETFLRFVRSEHGRRNERHAASDKPLAYLLAIARNLCIDAGRAACTSRAVPTAFPTVGLDVADPHDEVSDVELAFVLESLDAETRELIELRFDQGLGIGEIADVLDVSRFTVRRRLKRALDLLKHELVFPFQDER